MKYTKIPASTFENLQLNAGILVDTFNPETGEIGNLLGATTGGITFNDTVNFSDFGDDIDNCPKNTKELKKVDSHEVKMSGTFVTVTAEVAKKLAAVADIDGQNSTHIIPRNDLAQTDFTTVWWIGDYSDVNTGDGAGFIAIKLFNALSTGGFQIKTTDKKKGNFAFEFTGHYSIDAQDVVPYEIYVKQGNEVVTPSVLLDAHSLSLVKDATHTLVATPIPSEASVTFSSGSDSVATVGTSTGLVTAIGAGNTIITASITVDGVTYTDTCTVVVTVPAVG